MAREIDNQLPFIQVDQDVEAKALRLAPLLGISAQHAIGGAVLLWRGLADRRRIRKAIEADGGLVLLTYKEAESLLLLAFSVKVDPEVMVSLGFLEPTTDNRYRVRGMSRYVSSERTRIGRKSKKGSSGVRPHSDPTPTPLRPHSSVESDPTPMPQEVRGESREVILKEEEESLLSAVADLPTLSDIDSPKVAQLQKLWNDTAASHLPRWRETNGKRRRSAAARLRERDVADYEQVIRRINASAFLTGGNDRGWLANPDFFLRADTATKVLEGQYDNRTPKALASGDKPRI